MIIDAVAARGVLRGPTPLPDALPAPSPLPPIGLDRARAQPLLIALIASAVVGVAALRFWGLATVGFNPEEAATAGQAAAILGAPDLAPFFDAFQGPPQLFHVVLAAVFAVTGVGDLGARLLATVVGVGTVAATYLAARDCYNQRVALIAAAFIGFMPYHLLVSRQALPDGPAALWATLALCCVARFVRTERSSWVVAAAALLGLAILTKESALIFAGVLYLFLARRHWTKLTRGALFASAGVLALLALAYPLAYFLSGEGSRWTGYVLWQLVRRGEQPWYDHLIAIVPTLGAPVILGLVGAGPLLWRERGWREALLALWVGVPLLFFVLWPVKGFAHLLVIAPPVAILAARAFMELPRVLRRPVPEPALATVVAISCLWLALTSAWMLRAVPLGTLPPGAAGLIGGRNTAGWIDDNLPRGATLISTDPALAEVVQFYGHRRTLGLSVPTGLALRNPAHEPIESPDLRIRQSEIQYIVWDTHAEARYPAEAERLLAYVERYHGREIYRYEGERISAGGRVTFPISIVYEVRP